MDISAEKIKESIIKKVDSFLPKSPNAWQKSIRDAIASIPWVRYKFDGDSGQGVTENIYWKDELILEADSSNPNSFCCGAVMEAYIKALPLYNQEYSEDITEEILKDLARWAFLYSPDKKEGIAGGLEKYSLGKKIPIEEAQFGDLTQMEKFFFNEKWDDGHTQIILGKEEREGKPIIWSWSSSKAKMNIDGEEHLIHGHVVDWFWFYREKNNMARQWHTARVW